MTNPKLSGVERNINDLWKFEFKVNRVITISYWNDTIYIAVRLFSKWYRFLFNGHNKSTIFYQHKTIYYRWNEVEGHSGELYKRGTGII